MMRANHALNLTLAPYRDGLLLPAYRRSTFATAKRDLGGLLGMLTEAEQGASWVTPQVLQYGSGKGIEALSTLKKLGDEAGIPTQPLNILALGVTRKLKELGS